MATDRRLWFTHKCRFCSYLFVCEKDLVYHEATHDAASFACDNCSCVFDNAEQLTVHVNDGCSVADSSTEIGRQHVCGTCGEIFRFVRELYRHYGEHHMDVRPALPGRKPDVADGASVCANCGATFSGTASLKVHLWKAHNLNVVQQPDHILEKNGDDVTVVCRHSGSPLPCRRLLMPEDKPFKCSMCNWSFKYDFSFHAHMKMHEEKQRVLEEMVRANCESPSSAVDEVTVMDVGTDSAVSTTREVRVPIMLFPLKRKLQNSDDADCFSGPKASIIYATKHSRSNSCLTADADDCVRQIGSEPCSEQHSVDQISLKPVRVTGVSAELLYQSPKLCPSVIDASRSVIKQPSLVDCSPRTEEPFRFACKLCNFKCRYDFSYIAHLNQHDKLKELEIDDLQSHLVASSTQTPSDSHIPNKYAIKVISTDTGDMSRAKGHTQVVDSSGISYILLCPGAVDQPTLVTDLPKPRSCESTTFTQPTDAVDCLNSNVVFVDEVNTGVEQDLDSAARIASDDDDVDFSVGPEMQFLDSTGGETLYVVNETDLPVAVPVDAVEHQKSIVYEEAETEVVLSPQPSDRQLLDVASLCSDSDAQSDESTAGEDSFTCYYCNAAFTRKHQLQQHILRLHVD